MLQTTPWHTVQDTTDVQEFLARQWPAVDHPGGKGWEWAIGQLPADTLIARREGSIVGWAGVTDGQLTIQVPDDRQAARTLLDWAMERGSEHDLEIVVLDGDRMLHTLLDESGFGPAGADGRTAMFHPAVRKEPVLPPGYRIRPIGPGEQPDRVEVHRRAWKPISLPWPGDDATSIDPDAESSFLAEHFARLTQLPMYSPGRDFVVQAPDGSLAACCTLWSHPALGTTEIEPLGVLPEHRRRGLATALCRHVESVTAALGGTEVFINTWHLDDYPAPPPPICEPATRSGIAARYAIGEPERY